MRQLLSKLLSSRSARGVAPTEAPASARLTALCLFNIEDTFAEALHDPAVLLQEVLAPLPGAVVLWAGAGRVLLQAPAATAPVSKGVFELAAVLDFPSGTSEEQLDELGSSVCTDRFWMPLALKDVAEVTAELVGAAETAAASVGEPLPAQGRAEGGQIEEVEPAVARAEAREIAEIRARAGAGWMDWLRSLPQAVRSQAAAAYGLLRFALTRMEGEVHLLHLVRFRDRRGGEVFTQHLANDLAALRLLGPGVVDAQLLWLGAPAPRRALPEAAAPGPPHTPPPSPAGPAQAPPTGDWDLAFVVRYGSKQQFLRSALSRGWRHGTALREAALADSLLLATTPPAAEGQGKDGKQSAVLAKGTQGERLIPVGGAAVKPAL